MKALKSYLFVGLLACISFAVFQSCTLDPQQISTYQEILKYADSIKVINTHEHQHLPEEYGVEKVSLYGLIHSSYLMQDIITAGGDRLSIEQLNTLGLQEQWNIFGDLLNFTRATSYYGHFVRGFRKLYDFDELYFTEANIPPLSEKITENYSDYKSWFKKAFQVAGFEVMFNDQYWKSFNTDIDTAHFALVFHINQLVLQVNKRPASGEELQSIYKEASEEGKTMRTYDDYLNYCDHLFQKNIRHGAVCIKNSLAYSRTLDYKEGDYDKARKLFSKSSESLSRDEAMAMQNHMFHWIIEKSMEYDLPIQIHTGYLAGDGNSLENSHPLKLNHLFIKYPEANFVLFHGGYPWTSEFIAMGKMFQNVYLDLVWLPQISREKAVLALDEILDCVPYNKLFWGGDCAFIEESTGSLEFAKSVVAETLAKRVERGLLTKDVAYDVVKKIFRENAVRVFKLEEKLGRTF